MSGMSGESRRRPLGTRSRLFSKLAELAASEAGEIATPERITDFLEHYFRHVDYSGVLTRPAAQVVKALGYQFRLSWTRKRGENRLCIIQPSLNVHGWEASGHVVVMLTTDDKPWLVDSLRLAVASRGWSVRELIHPRFQVVRDPDGTWVDIDPLSEGRATAEAWIWLEVSAPLGVAASDAILSLEEAIRASLADLDAATRDREAMLARMHDAASRLDTSSHPRAARAAELLRWLADGRFLVLGSRDYSLISTGDGSAFVPRPSGLGLLGEEQPARAAFGATVDADEIIVVTKDSRPSRVRRPGFMDYVGVYLHDDSGERLERRFLGLFSAQALQERVSEIPLLAQKAQEITEKIGCDPDSYDGRAVATAIERHPREELFQASVAELTPMIAEIAQVDDSQRVTTILRRGAWDRFFTALIYFPRERYNTRVRERITTLLTQITGAESSEWTVTMHESPMARLQCTLKMPQGTPLPELDIERLQQAIEQASRTWDDRFIEIADRLDSAQRGVEWSDGYKEAYAPLEAVNDLVTANTISGPEDMAQTMYVPSPPENGVDFRIKMLRVGSEMVLSRMLPHLSSLGIDVIDERPFDFELRGVQAHIYDFGIRLPGGPERLTGWTHEGRTRFTSAVAASYVGLCEADELNKLVTGTDMTWQQVSVLRAVSRYLRQLGTTYSQPYIAQTLYRHRDITRLIIRLFEAKFDPLMADEDSRGTRVQELTDQITQEVEQIAALDEDRIIRQYLEVLQAMVRTNFFALSEAALPSGTPSPQRSALALKICPDRLTFVAQPQPRYEIFVYSPQVEGVHLRFGKVARGGIRWSDRAEDYRTEVLGLVCAQMVKNAIIVPVGAKGGFYPLRLDGLDPQARVSEARASYATFIRALLSVTDTIVDNQVVHPDHVLALDGDDPYLVVAADKGTANFSDLANQLAIERGFWLGDAFASGGRDGYDHKQMGITARGAWVSVRRHLAELGINPDTDRFTVVGIGDMSGDVFGNGMLLSGTMALVAAFNHRHIFLDPDPDPGVAYRERRRLFELPRSGWNDYDPALISQGGGVYDRSIKSIPITPQVAQVLGIDPQIGELTPNEVISAILRAPVDVMWNGGIGTWVKSSAQTHAEVGDHTNNLVRVNANQVRARCVGEGGNLGWTQAARVEYALNGGRINADFIDNSGGVDSSDYEVNIKILLAGEVAAGRLSLEERNLLMHQMTEEVATSVLRHNLSQNRALANSLLIAAEHLGDHEALMVHLEKNGYVHRELDGLPSTEEVEQRLAVGRGLTDPELAMLLAAVKIALTEEVIATDLPDDPYVKDRLVQYFPDLLRQRYADRMADHPLARQIITTVAVNRFVDSQGISAAHRLCEETGASINEVILAQLAARNLFDAGMLETAAAKSDLPDLAQRVLRLSVRRLVEWATRWLLYEHRDGMDIRQIVEQMKPGVRQITGRLPDSLTPQAYARYTHRCEALAEEGVPDGLAEQIATWEMAHMALPIVRVSLDYQRDVDLVARVYFELGERIGISTALMVSEQLPRGSRWEIMAQASLRDELTSAQAAITASAMDSRQTEVSQIVQDWWQGHPHADELRELFDQVSTTRADLAPLSVAVGMMRNLLDS